MITEAADPISENYIKTVEEAVQVATDRIRLRYHLDLAREAIDERGVEYVAWTIKLFKPPHKPGFQVALSVRECTRSAKCMYFAGLE
jgi:hypothetical protein